MSVEREEEFDEEELPDACLGTLNSIRCYSTKPGRSVFIEQGNPNAWISTDETVEIHE